MPLTIHIFGPCSYPFEHVVFEILECLHPLKTGTARQDETRNQTATPTHTRQAATNRARAPPHRWGPVPAPTPPITAPCSGRRCVNDAQNPTPNGPPARS